MELFDPQIIASIGFPIVVASYLLIRNEKTIKDLTLVIQRLTDIISERECPFVAKKKKI